jgi:transposase InsO family protein
LDYDDIIKWQSEFDGTFVATDGDSEPTVRAMSPPQPILHLTDEEKLLLAQEKRGKRVPDAAKRESLLKHAHAAGHFGNKAMLYAIEREGYWWPTLRKDIQAVINKCNDCRRYNTIVHGHHPTRSVSAFLPGDHYQMDLAHMTESYDGFKYCLVLIDVFTGFVMLKPLRDHSAEEVARAFWEISTVIGLPRILQSDNGSEFANKVLKALTHMFGIDQRFISEYHPQADGKVERAVGTIKRTLMKLLRGANIFWPLHLPFVQYCYNDKVQALTGSTPFALMFGRRPNALKDFTLDPHTSLPRDIKGWLRKQEELLSLVYPAVGARASAKQKQMHAKLDGVRKRLISEQLQPGTLVMIKDPNYLLNPDLRPSSAPKYVGPYVVARSTRFGNYELVDELGKRLDRGVPLDQIKVLSKPDKRPASTLPDEYDDDKVYIAESILSYKINKLGQLEYLVKWKDYPASDATWINSEEFVDIDIVTQFFRALMRDPKKRRIPRIRVLACGDIAMDLSVWSLLAHPTDDQAD